MKILVISDLHGKKCWDNINPDKYDKIVFLGDYVDSFTISDADILNNLKAIIKFKKSYTDKVVLLLGNHDVQYLYYPHFLCSGFRMSMLRELSDLFNENINAFLVAWQYQNYLFTHAGLTNTWYKEFISSPLYNRIADEQLPIADLLNKANQTAMRGILHRAGSSRGGLGCGGITWADKSELMSDMIIGYHQVVGHTPVQSIERFSYDDSTSVLFLDVLDTLTYFHEMEI